MINAMNTAEEIIFSYIDHLENAAYLDAAMAQYGVSALVTAAVGLVDSLDEASVSAATLWIRDVSIGLFRHDITSAFRSAWPSSGLFDGLDRCLRVRHFHLRADAVYTLGKLCFADHSGRLHRIFDERRDVDPLLMSRLLFEMAWLTPNEQAHWQRVGVLAHSPEPLSRWAALHCIVQSLSHQPFPEAEVLLSKLMQDACPYVQKEALYRHAEWHWCIPHSALTAAQRKAHQSQRQQQRRQIPALKPALTFDELEIQFWRNHHEVDYTTSDILTFLATRG